MVRHRIALPGEPSFELAITIAAFGQQLSQRLSEFMGPTIDVRLAIDRPEPVAE